jgi:hypothetical protein
VTVAVVRPVTAGVIAALEATGRKAGDGRKPDATAAPYMVVRVGTARLDGSMLAPFEDGVHRVTVVSVGVDQHGAEWMRDLARPILLDPDLLIEGHAVARAELVVGREVIRNDSVTPNTYEAVDLFHLHVTPIEGGS